MRLSTLQKLLGHECLETTVLYIDTSLAFKQEEYRRTNPFGE